MDIDDSQALREEVGTEVASPSYSIISFPAAKLPEQYTALVFSKWLRSLRHGNPVCGKIPSAIYYEKYHLFIENLMKKPDAIIKMGVLTDDHDVVLGFSMSREDVLDYVHVHRDYRKNGISSQLIPNNTTTFSHFTLTWLKVWRAGTRYKHLHFNPYA